jgi:hypothetical protein
MIDTKDAVNTDVELSDVVARFGDAYRSQYGNIMMPSHDKALSDIEACCTETLGGSRYSCDDCGEAFWHYHACRNRSCPKCQGHKTEEWLARREAELLPCEYFHAVATVPSELRSLFYREQKTMYGMLMQVAAEAVRTVCLKPRFLRAMPGILAVLHTWTAQMDYHPHVHMLITGGGVTLGHKGGCQWSPTRDEYLVPVLLLSQTIAQMMHDRLKEEHPNLFRSVPRSVWRSSWVTFIKRYGHGNDAVLHYLSRYVQKIAISNSRIIAIGKTHVTFRYKDRKSNCWRTERLPGVEFLRRFLQHVLPRGFHKVRYYGLWHHTRREQASRAWLLLILDSSGPPTVMRVVDIVEAYQQLDELVSVMQNELDEQSDGETTVVTCPNCGSERTTRIESRAPPGCYLSSDRD